MGYNPDHPNLESGTPLPKLRDEKVLLSNDAKNRSLRTFLQGIAIDVAVAVAALVLASVDTINDKAGLIVFCTALAKTIITAIASYVMRAFLDRSNLPTPLPPADPGEPDSPVV